MALKEGFAQTVRIPSYGRRGGWLNRHITFVVPKKSLNLQFILLYLRYKWGGVGWKLYMGGGGWKRQNTVI